MFIETTRSHLAFVVTNREKCKRGCVPVIFRCEQTACAKRHYRLVIVEHRLLSFETVEKSPVLKELRSVVLIQF